jgi:transcriptional regulator with XRE-family HTH domain
MVETSGRVELVKYLEPEGRSQAALADAIGTSQTNVSAWTRGIQRPGDEYREALEIVTGIPADSWRTPEESAKVEQAREHVAKLAKAG